MDDSKYQNLFVGINPVLHEILLMQNGWKEFHGIFLVQFLLELRSCFEGMPYTVTLEESLQIKTLMGTTQSYEPDLLISSTKRENFVPSQFPSADMMALIDILPIIEKEPEPLALMIRRRDDNYPVTWIELLSPSNKLPSMGYYQYRAKRDIILASQVAFMELDFIHHKPPTLSYRDYSKQIKGAYPFHITVMIPYPNIEAGVAHTFHFGILDKIPTVPIPLLGTDSFQFDFDVFYQQIFVRGKYNLEIAHNMPQLTTYHPDDRQKILAYLRQNGDVS